MKIIVKEINWKEDSAAVLSIEETAFPEHITSGLEDLMEQAQKGFGFIAYHDNLPVGYFIGMPLDKAHYGGCYNDIDAKGGNSAYIESLAVVPFSDERIFAVMLTKLRSYLKEQSYKKIKMHTQLYGNLYQTLLRLGAKELGTFDNFMGWEESYAYLEIKI